MWSSEERYALPEAKMFKIVYYLFVAFNLPKVFSTVNFIAGKQSVSVVKVVD